MTPRQGRRRAVYGAAVLAAALAALVRCSGDSDIGPVAALEAAASPAIQPTIAAMLAATSTATPIPKKKPTSTPKPAKVAVAKKKSKKKLRADVAPKDFEVSGVSVSQTGYTAKIEGWVRMTRKGALAQPRMTFDLKDGNGDLIRAGSFTPLDATGPVWLGYDELGLKRVAFTTTVDLRAENGGVLPSVPPRPYSASVRVAEVIDAKPSK